ncbi:MAG: McrC family protein [Myxococcota bacterium]|nr:McrC family protein [Myxococcota bacterium]
MRARAELFEHETIRVGEPLRGGDGAVLRAKDFDALVRFNDAHGGKYFEVGHKRIKLTQYVGYLEVGELAIEVLPKADRERVAQGEASVWRAALLDMLQIAADIRLESPDAASQTMGRSSLLDLIALRFVEEVTRLLREGLVKGYRDEEVNGATYRGRLMVAAHLRENLVRADRFYVRCQTYDRDTPVNRIVATALHAMEGLAISPSIASRAALCRAQLGELTPVRPTRELFDRVRLGRATARYATALTLARMILERRSPTLRGGAVEVFALLFDMNVLWERFISVMFRRAVPADLVVSTQENRGFWRSESRAARRVRPDLVVRSRETGEVVLVADTKWKVLRKSTPGDEDLRQMFVYNELFGASRSWLLYPSVTFAAHATGSYDGRVHGCSTVHLGLLAGSAWSVATVREQVRTLLAGLSGGAGATIGSE